MSLKSVMLIVLALLFFAAGGYFFYTSTLDCMGREQGDPHPNPAQPSSVTAPATFSIPVE